MTPNEKAIDALDDLEKVFGEGLTPHGWEMFDTIRQALTPQSSADEFGSDKSRLIAALDVIRNQDEAITELKAAVEGMKRHVSDVDNGHNIGFNAACDQFLCILDEVIGRE